MTTCTWNGRGNPRLLRGRHGPECPNGALSGPESAEEPCGGCLPCPERHCAVCARVHADGACPECIAATRDDLAAIRIMCGALPAEVEHRGVNGEAMMLLGPSADPEAWRNRAMSAMRGRVDARYLEDCRDEQHPLWVLGTWEQLYREEFDQPSDLRQTIARAGDYLERQMARMAETEDVPFEDFAGDVRRCRGHLEATLHDGEQVETGAPCPVCRERGEYAPALVLDRDDNDPTGAGDKWRCSRCKTWWSEADYRLRVGEEHLEHADELTASDMVARTRVPAGTIRRWAATTTRRIDGETVEIPPKLRPSGRSHDGRKLYRVSDVLALRDGETVEVA